jgi:hypothetical protein
MLESSPEWRLPSAQIHSSLASSSPCYVQILTPVRLLTRAAEDPLFDMSRMEAPPLRTAVPYLQAHPLHLPSSLLPLRPPILGCPGDLRVLRRTPCCSVRPTEFESRKVHCP